MKTDMIFRLSQNLNGKIKAGTLPAMPLDENPFADWSCHLFVADRTQYILLTNTQSLYSSVMFGRGIVNDSQFIVRALDSIREQMEDDGQAFAYHKFIVPSTGNVHFAKALNRSVTGSMSDLIRFATAWLIEDDLSPHDAGFKLNDILLSAIAPSKSEKYGRPREAFKKLASEKPNESKIELP